MVHSCSVASQPLVLFYSLARLKSEQGRIRWTQRSLPTFGVLGLSEISSGVTSRGAAGFDEMGAVHPFRKQWRALH